MGDLGTMLRIRREAERIVRELFQPDLPSGMRVVADTVAEAGRYVFEVELAGVRARDLRVYILGDTLIIEGHKSEERAGARVYERAERQWGDFRRVLDLPGPADLSRASAELRGGLLTIEVPGIADRRGRMQPFEVPVADLEAPVAT